MKNISVHIHKPQHHHSRFQLNHKVAEHIANYHLGTNHYPCSSAHVFWPVSWCGWLPSPFSPAILQHWRELLPSPFSPNAHTPGHAQPLLLSLFELTLCAFDVPSFVIPVTPRTKPAPNRLMMLSSPMLSSIKGSTWQSTGCQRYKYPIWKPFYCCLQQIFWFRKYSPRAWA